MALIEKRYAQAIADLAEQEGKLDEYEDEFKDAAQIFEMDDVRTFISNPEIVADAKKKFVSEVFDSNISKNMVNFLKLLIDKKRIELLPFILSEYKKIFTDKKSIISIKINSARPLSDDQIERIKNKYIMEYKASGANVEVNIDEGLIGGVKVVIGDMIAEDSVKGRIDMLRKFIINAEA